MPNAALDWIKLLSVVECGHLIGLRAQAGEFARSGDDGAGKGCATRRCARKPGFLHLAPRERSALPPSPGRGEGASAG